MAYHYWDSDSCGDDWVARKKNGQTYGCIHDDGSMIAGYPHIDYPSNPDFVRMVLDRAKVFKNTKVL